jgi:predicted Zn-dependent protease
MTLKILYRRVALALQHGDATRAHRLLDMADASLGNDPRFLSLRASVHEYLGQRREAERLLTRAVRAGRRQPSLVMELGEFYLDDGRPAVAVRWLERALRGVLSRPIAKNRRQLGIEITHLLAKAVGLARKPGAKRKAEVVVLCRGLLRWPDSELLSAALCDVL